MDLLEALMILREKRSLRHMKRAQLYAAVRMITLKVSWALRAGDSVTFDGRMYAVVKANGDSGITVDNGRGPAMLGHRRDDSPFPFAEYDEQLFFAENCAHIVGQFSDLVAQNIYRMDAAEQTIKHVSTQEKTA